MCGTPIPVPVPVLKTPAGAGGESGSAPGEKPGRVSGRPTRKKPGEEDPLFCAFYRAYPLHEDRPAAWKAWRKLKPDADLAGAIMAGVKRYKATKPDWQNWKQPGPWLNARRWEDEAPTTPESPASKFRPPSDFDTQPPRRSNSPCPTR